MVFSVWITLSSSVILFNKHILDYAQFRKYQHLVELCTLS